MIETASRGHPPPAYNRQRTSRPSRPCAREGCGQEFEVASRHPGQQFCSAYCRTHTTDRELDPKTGRPLHPRKQARLETQTEERHARHLRFLNEICPDGKCGLCQTPFGIEAGWEDDVLRWTFVSSDSRKLRYDRDPKGYVIGVLCLACYDAIKEIRRGRYGPYLAKSPTNWRFDNYRPTQEAK
jgi:hypothetical protein